MGLASYEQTRAKLTTYFDQTAADAWAKLTSDAPVNGIRATVRQGRDDMRATLLSWLPDDMQGMTLLDAGCGTGALALIAAERGAAVTAVDVSPTLVGLAKERGAQVSGCGSVDFKVGDMLGADLGEFDYVVAMDSLIHYKANDIAMSIASLAERTRKGILFTFAPKTPALTVMHIAGRMIPQLAHRAPAIVPVGEQNLRSKLLDAPQLDDFHIAQSHRVSSAFYKSHAMAVVR
ncbi:MAG: magnesium protoporphyrin IX methyltransferase [Pseudomonadota bacterium]